MSNSLAKRDNRGRLIAGTTPNNPRGRPRSGFAFTETVRQIAGQPARMMELAMLVWDIAHGRAVCIDRDWHHACREARERGEPAPPRPTSGETIQPTIAEMQKAQEFLFRYGGIATQQVDVNLTGDAGPKLFNFEALSPGELDAMESALAKAAGYAGALDVTTSVNDPDETP